MKATGWLFWSIWAAAWVLVFTTIGKSIFWPMVAIWTPVVIVYCTRIPMEDD